MKDKHVLRKEGDKYFIYFGGKYPEIEDYCNPSVMSKDRQAEKYRSDCKQWFLSCEQKGNKVEVADGQVGAFMRLKTKPNGFVDGSVKEGIPIPLCYEVRRNPKSDVFNIESMGNFAYFKEPEKSPDRSEDRSSLKEENEKLKKEIAFFNEMRHDSLERFDEIQNLNVELKSEIERLRGDLARTKGEYENKVKEAKELDDKLILANSRTSDKNIETYVNKVFSRTVHRFFNDHGLWPEFHRFMGYSSMSSKRSDDKNIQQQLTDLQESLKASQEENEYKEREVLRLEALIETIEKDANSLANTSTPGWDWFGWISRRIPILREGHNKIWINQLVQELLIRPQQQLKDLQEENQRLKRDLKASEYTGSQLAEHIEELNKIQSRLSNELEGCRADKSKT